MIFLLFVYIKTFSQIRIFVYKWKLQWLPSEKYNVHVLICKRSKKNCKTFYIQKSGHLAKSKTISVTFLYTKSNKCHVTQFFMSILKLNFIYKKHYTLRYVAFLYKRSEPLRKKQDNLRYVFIYKNWKSCVTWFLLNFWNWRHRLELPVLNYHIIMAIYPYSFMVVINQFSPE